MPRSTGTRYGTGRLAAGTLLLALACSREASFSDYVPPPPPLMEAVAAPSSKMKNEKLAGAAMPQYDESVKNKLDEDGRYQVREKGSARGSRINREVEAAPQQEQRMVHYDGSVRLRVTDPRRTLEQAALMGAEMGGYIEQQNGTMVTLRVPVARVREAFAKLLTMGDVLSRSLTAKDVTDAFTASELRLKTSHASRDRLITLLASVKDEDERLEILGEIRRLTEYIDGLDLQLKTLAKLAAYSRLTLETVAREQRSTAKNDGLAAYRWIDALSPFRRDEAARGRLLKLTTPKEMVVLDDARHWVAESADGSVVWSSKRNNAPRGNNEFWAATILGRLGGDFAQTKRETIGDFEVVTFIDGGTTHYRYQVGVRASGDELDVVEVYYPTPEQEARYAPSINAILAGGAS